MLLLSIVAIKLYQVILYNYIKRTLSPPVNLASSIMTADGHNHRERSIFVLYRVPLIWA